MRNAEATVTNRKATASTSLAISSGLTDSVTCFDQPERTLKSERY